MHDANTNKCTFNFNMACSICERICFCFFPFSFSMSYYVLFFFFCFLFSSKLFDLILKMFFFLCLSLNIFMNQINDSLFFTFSLYSFFYIYLSLWRVFFSRSLSLFFISLSLFLLNLGYISTHTRIVLSTPTCFICVTKHAL